MQREPIVKTLRSPLPAELLRHCVLNFGIQHLALTHCQSGKMKILNISCPLVKIEPTTVMSCIATFVPLRLDAPNETF